MIISTMYINMKPLCYTYEINILLYVNYTSIFKIIVYLMSFDIYISNHHHNQNNKHIHHPQNFPLPLCRLSLPLPTLSAFSQANTDLYSVTIGYLGFFKIILYTCNHTLNGSSLWFVLLCIVLLRASLS